MAAVLFKDESYRIVGACFEVYNHQGWSSRVIDPCGASSLAEDSSESWKLPPMASNLDVRDSRDFVEMPDFEYHATRARHLGYEGGIAD